MSIDPKITVSEIADYLNLTVQAVHSRIKNQSLQEKRNQNKIYFSHHTSRALTKPNGNSFKISFSVVKGGVGKTTLTEALAIRMCLYGLRVLCIDCDQQANLTIGLGMDEKSRSSPILIDLIQNKADSKDAILNVIPGLDLIPSRLDNVSLDGYLMINRVNPATLFSNLFSEIFNNYDLIIFDCPPTLGSTVCASILASDLLIAPLNPDVYSYQGIEIMQKEIENIYTQFNKKIEWKILLNKFDSKTILSTDYISQIIKDPIFSERLLKSVIRTSQDFPNMKKKEKTLFDSLKKSTAKEDIDSLCREIIGLKSFSSIKD